MALRAFIKETTTISTQKASVAALYKATLREIPRVLTLYDIDMRPDEARRIITGEFRKNSFVQDERVIGIMVQKGYMELEETLMQWKQKTHLLRILQPLDYTPEDNLTDDQKLYLASNGAPGTTA